MTIASLLLGTIAGQILFVLTKILFINSLNLESLMVMVGFYLILIVETIAVVRRMGVLNYFESIFLIAVWLITSILVDLVITTSYTGRDVYGTLYFWMTYLAIGLAILVFHKKLHVEVRRENIK
jgi:hypothetical protein